MIWDFIIFYQYGCMELEDEHTGLLELWESMRTLVLPHAIVSGQGMWRSFYLALDGLINIADLLSSRDMVG
jgi:hypothetical protein